MINLQNSYFAILFGGIALFLYGMSLVSHSLEKLMASRISLLMNRISQSQFLSISIGILLTVVLQSSGAVTSMLVGLGTAKVISLPQVMGVIIGTAIGSTLTVQLISLNLSQYAIPVFSLAFFVYFMSKKSGIRNVAAIFMGFGLLFIGVGLISNAAQYFAGLELVKEYVKDLHDNPFLSLAISMVFCAGVQSSAVTIGLVMGLAHAGVLSIEDAMYWVYGANIGTTSTALMAAAGANYVGKQVAWAHFFYKTASALVFLIGPVNSAFAGLLQSFNPVAERAIANGHFFFNLVSAALFYPFIKPGARVIEKLFPKSANEDFSAEYLKLDTYHSSALAISYANREIMRTADIVISMLKDSIRMFDSNGEAMVESIKARDNQVDYLYRETKMFLLDHANKSTSAVSQNIMNMIMFLSDLERAADSIDLNLTNLAVKKIALRLEFSHEGWDELRHLHEDVIKAGMMAVNSYNNRNLCEETIQLKRDLAKLEITLREHHIGRLNRGLRESINTSSIHLDLLSEYKRIVGLLCSHAYNTRT